MPNQSAETFTDLAEQALGRRIPEHLTEPVNLAGASSETRGFILRALALMRRSRYAATDFNPALTGWLASIPGMLPGAWGGRIPPLTLPGRHKKLDEYVADRFGDPVGEKPVFVDLGCGFPPATTADTARRLSDWEVYGVDSAFHDYVLYDPEGNYACFDGKGAFQYFQALTTASGRKLYADPAGTRKRFETLFAALHPSMEPSDGTASACVEQDGSRLIHHHIRDFESENLKLEPSDIFDSRLPPARAVRCMNLLVYFDPETRRRVLARVSEMLEPGGVLVAGTNGLGIQTRYFVYRKEGGALLPESFAFGLDNVGPIVFMPFFSIHEQDPEARLLADLAGALRKSASFGPDFSSRLDALMGEHGLCRRGTDGFLAFPETEFSPAEFLGKAARIWQEVAAGGFPDRAVSALEEAGYDAWVNRVGDIAVRPSAQHTP